MFNVISCSSMHYQFIFNQSHKAIMKVRLLLTIQRNHHSLHHKNNSYMHKLKNEIARVLSIFFLFFFSRKTLQTADSRKKQEKTLFENSEWTNLDYSLDNIVSFHIYIYIVFNTCFTALIKESISFESVWYLALNLVLAQAITTIALQSISQNKPVEHKLNS